MATTTFRRVWEADRAGMCLWLIMEALALTLGARAAETIARGHVTALTILLYGVATGASIRAGYDIADRVALRTPHRREIVQFLNDRVHKWCVVGLNGIVSAALVYRLATDARMDTGRRYGSLGIIGLFGAAYIASYLSKAIRAHSVLARFRSAALRALLIMIMALLVWGMVGESIAAVIGGAVLRAVVWPHLARERDRWGWDQR